MQYVLLLSLQTILAHARAARVLHGFPDMPPKADSPGHACATQQAVHPSQVHQPLFMHRGLAYVIQH